MFYVVIRENILLIQRRIDIVTIKLYNIEKTKVVSIYTK